jgi:tetratricopeptide (TPR) repeat protein
VALRAGDRLTAARAALGRGQADIGLGRRHSACRWLRESIDLLSGQSRPEIVHALSYLAATEAVLGDYAAGVAHARQAQQQAAKLGDRLLEARACRALGKLLTRMQANMAEGEQVLERALALATAAADPSEMAACLFRIFWVMLHTGQIEKCRAASLARVDAARRAGPCPTLPRSGLSR